MVCFTLDIMDTDKDVLVSMQNLSLDMLHKITEEGSVDVILSSKYYLYGLYEKLKISDYTFMILKVTKKNVVMINTYE